MLNKILMPSGGQTTDEMVILKWRKNKGDFIKKGDILFEVETDKAILEIESFAEGKLLEIKYAANAIVKVGEVVALIGEEEDLLADTKSGRVAENTLGSINNSDNNDKIASLVTIDTIENIQFDKRILASPLAKSLAKIENIKLEDVSRFLTKTVIKKDDIYLYLRNKKQSAVKYETNDVDNDHYVIEVNSLRKTIARRMIESVSTVPHFYISIDIDMTSAIALRNKLNDKTHNKLVKVSFNDIVMKVVSKAIENYPIINSDFNENQIRVFKDVNIGLAVAVENGIVVPVVKSVNIKSLSEISIANKQNIENVKNNQILEANLRSGTITISNLGMFGIDSFTAIINQPQSCILAVSSILKKAVVVEHQIIPRDIMNITGSFDHRVIDGAIGAPFMRKIKELLEEPELLLY